MKFYLLVSCFVISFTAHSKSFSSVEEGFLACLHTLKILRGGGLWAEIDMAHPQAQDFFQGLEALPHLDMSREEGVGYIIWIERDTETNRFVWRWLSEEEIALQVSCSFPEPAVSESTLRKIEAFDPEQTFKDYGF